MESFLTPVELAVRQVLQDVDVAIEHVYFPIRGVVSIVSVMQDGVAVEAATVGNEGFVGLPVALGARKGTQQAFVQVGGAALRMTASDFIAQFARSGALAEVVGRYTQALFTQVAQASACNRLHSVDERCARWLLLTHDRVGEDSFSLTHLFLAQMLGVRRATVTEAAARLQRKRLIRYVHGEMTIVSRRGLEAASCECYAVIRDEFDRLLRNGSAESAVIARARRRSSRNGETAAGTK